MHPVLRVPVVEAPVHAEVDFHLFLRVRVDVDVGRPLPHRLHERGLEQVDERGAVDLLLQLFVVDQVVLFFKVLPQVEGRLLVEALQVLVVFRKGLREQLVDGRLGGVAQLELVQVERAGQPVHLRPHGVVGDEDHLAGAAGHLAVVGHHAQVEQLLLLLVGEGLHGRLHEVEVPVRLVEVGHGEGVDAGGPLVDHLFVDAFLLGQNTPEGHVGLLGVAPRLGRLHLLGGHHAPAQQHLHHPVVCADRRARRHARGKLVDEFGVDLALQFVDGAL